MEYVLLIFGLVLILFGIIGSILPALPGAPISWVGLLLIYLIPEIKINYWILGITLLLTIIIAVLDYILPSKGTKHFGGTKYGIWGTNIGLIVGLFFPPFGFVIGPFLGAFAGELIYNSKDTKGAFKAAVGSFLGLLASTFMKVLFCLLLLGIYLVVFFSNLEVWF
ncbi:DUF456 domain-containing protein [uncultured Flavobacterium sp.]|uniref:DUF456 domain-containing protein n=1 Tax=uncultured Flavobacterium sp. TaxID=165435 RepID=UPI0030ECAB77|tara:strand:- start:212658 stop:213155 length:498 start_codon:yes stop_codon:yes gene_type:complete